MTDTKTLVLTASDVEQVVQQVGMNEIMDELIENMEASFREYDATKTIIPVRSGFNYKKPELGLVEWMPLHEYGEKIVIKMVGYHPDNPVKYNLPTIVSTISSYDTKTGHLKSLVDGVFLTALRTGGASAVASKILAHPNSTTLGLIGCGAQAVTQLHALSRIFPLQEVLFYDIDEATQQSFAERVAILDLPVIFKACSITEIVTHSDIICTATSIGIGEGPLFQNIPTKEHLHINAIGSDFPGKTELPVELLKQSFVCPDFVEQAMKEGECQQLLRDDIGADIFQCMEAPTTYQKWQQKRTVFDSTGLPLEDKVVMDLFLKHAQRLGLGQLIAIENMSNDAKNPYHFISEEREINIEQNLTIKKLEVMEKNGEID